MKEQFGVAACVITLLALPIGVSMIWRGRSLMARNIEALSQNEGVVVNIPCVESKNKECYFLIKDLSGNLYEGYVRDMQRSE